MLRELLILPKARRWMRATIAMHEAKARPIAECGLPRLAAMFNLTTLTRTRLIAVDRVPQPPLEQWGVAGGLLEGEAAGITLDQMIFVQRGQERDESLIFHELVHAVQWRTLGPNRFLALYGLLLLEHGYRSNPLEMMAYDLQSQFDAVALSEAEAVVQRRTQETFAAFRNRSWLHRAMLTLLR